MSAESQSTLERAFEIRLDDSPFLKRAALYARSVFVCASHCAMTMTHHHIRTSARPGWLGRRRHGNPLRFRRPVTTIFDLLGSGRS